MRMPRPEIFPSLTGDIKVPSDKSITHRAILFASLAEGESFVQAHSIGRDNLASARVMQQLGVEICGYFAGFARQMAEEEKLTEVRDSSISPLVFNGEGDCLLVIRGKGLHGLKAASDILDCGNSGTTSRLLCGILAGCQFSTTITGDKSLVKRPFARVSNPLALMGARFSADYLPLTVTGAELRGLIWESEKASAQVKSAILLAGLFAAEGVTVHEPGLSRDHSERMLRAMGCPIVEETAADGQHTVRLPEATNLRRLNPLNISVPGDFSSACFFLAAASIVPGSCVRIGNVGLNLSRTGFLNVSRRMGADIQVLEQRTVGGEEVGDLLVKSADLHGVEVSHEDVVFSIDEIPVLALQAAFSQGKTVIRGAHELRVKESDRLAMMAGMLRLAGIDVEEFADGLSIMGNPALLGSGDSLLPGAWLESHDHRILMCGALLNFFLTGRVERYLPEVVETSFPGFYDLLTALVAK